MDWKALMKGRSVLRYLSRVLSRLVVSCWLFKGEVEGLFWDEEGIGMG
jgi:hypothetical protein